MNAQEIADKLEEAAVALEFLGENSFSLRAFRAAAERVREAAGGLEAFIESVKRGDVSGIGKTLQAHIVSLAADDETFLVELKRQIPEGIFELLAIPGLGMKKLRTLHEELGISDLAALRVACESGAVAKLKGFGAKTEQKYLHALEKVALWRSQMLLSRARSVALATAKEIETCCAPSRVAVSGDTRRGTETVTQVEILAVTETPAQARSAWATHSGESHRNVAVSFTSSAEFPLEWFFSTGAPSHLDLVKRHAAAMGFDLARGGLCRSDGSPSTVSTETDIYHALGLAYIPPELREGLNEIEVAASAFQRGERALKLVEESEIRGIIHAHTTYSDGKQTLEQLALGIRALG
ncbi:MAG: hypothetical protein KDD44_05215, partial [Bdellovibrionales bacterium]|nr:hypothetical protein [Bdellovibrionales bacterium]